MIEAATVAERIKSPFGDWILYLVLGTNPAFAPVSASNPASCYVPERQQTVAQVQTPCCPEDAVTGPNLPFVVIWRVNRVWKILSL